VVAALVEDYRIAPGRLDPHGVGPLAPVAPNTTEDGRQKNRRVELVAR
jgi:outer membrane protein OmpA-like peptidoglycan-associated protein